MELMSERVDGLSRLVDNTPLLGVRLTFRGERRVIYAKCEQLRLTGSIKDRMALHILKRAYADGSLRPGQRIAEATSGNTGSAFAAIGRALGHPVTPDDNKKCLATDLLHEEPVRGEYLSSDVELTSVVRLPPSCVFCWRGVSSLQLEPDKRWHVLPRDRGLQA